jgi:hypothetical protein
MVIATDARAARRVVTVAVVAALAGGASALPGAAPAFALPGLTVELSPGSVDLKPGDRRTLTVTLIHTGPPARVDLTAAAPGGLSGDVTIASADSTCSGAGASVTCTVEVPGDSRRSVLLTLAARNPDSLGAGQARTDTSGSVTATLGPGSTSLTYAVTLHGPAPAQTPTQSQSSAKSQSSTKSQGSTNAGSTGVTGSPDGTAGAAPASADPGTASGGAYASPYRTASDPGWWSAVLIGFGVVLILAGLGILVARIVRRRRAREAERQGPWPHGGTFTDRAGDAAVYGPAVDPWAAGTDPR